MSKLGASDSNFQELGGSAQLGRAKVLVERMQEVKIGKQRKMSSYYSGEPTIQPLLIGFITSTTTLDIFFSLMGTAESKRSTPGRVE